MVPGAAIAHTPALTLIRRHARGFENVSERDFASEPGIEILLADDRHDFDAVSGDPIVDAICPTDAASITGSDLINRRIG